MTMHLQTQRGEARTDDAIPSAADSGIQLGLDTPALAADRMKLAHEWA